MNDYRICSLPGDGIGPEIIEQAKRVLVRVAELEGFGVTFEDELIGGAAIDATREAGGEVTALPQRTLDACMDADAVLLACVGGPQWESTRANSVRPEQGLLGIRKALELYINLRPIHVYEELLDASSLKPEVIRGVDILIVRELTGGIYFGDKERIYDMPGAAADGQVGQWASDASQYSEGEIVRVLEWAFREASNRPDGHITSVDKANVLETSRLWRELAQRISEKYPNVPMNNLYVDNAAMQLIADPRQFDVLVTDNMFGDILSDEAAQLTGSLGMLASASLGANTPLFEPAHGSAPDIAGKGIANPLGEILSAALLCRYGLNQPAAAKRIEDAVTKTLAEGWRTADIAGDTHESLVLGTADMGTMVVDNL